MDNIIKAIENSPIWEDLNNRCKDIYKKNNRMPSEEEYQALRNILICKTMLEDKEAMKEMAKYTYKELNNI